MERVENLLRLVLCPGIGAVSINRLLEHFGSADAVLGAKDAALREVGGIKRNHATALGNAESIDPRPEIDLAAQHNISLLAYDDPSYPQAIRSSYDPPCLLYVRGEIKTTDAMALAIVGTRRASRYGSEQADRFGGLFARAGFTVVSGLARGVDSFAHRGALAARGRTLAILGCGLLHMYPEENRDLAAEIAENGAIISEFPMEQQPSRDTFPRRNRIIAGLSLGVLVVEAPPRSGALITARHAVEMNREVFALPGQIDQDNAAGCHQLIRDGATLVRNLDDVLSELGPVADHLASIGGEPSVSEAMPPQMSSLAPDSLAPQNTTPQNEKEVQVIAALGEEPIHIDQICATTGLPVQTVSATLMILEIRRKVRQLPGKFFVRHDY